MADLPPLPPGFKLDQQEQQSVPPLPPGFTLDNAQPSAPAAQPPAEQPMSFGQRWDALLHGLGIALPVATPVMETAAQMTAGSVAAPAAGVAGLASLPAGADRAADNTNAVASALSYQPRTQGGQMLSRAVNAPFELLRDKAADPAGEYVSQKTGSPLLGALTNTAIQGAPALLLRGRGRNAEVGGDVTRTADVGPRAPARPGAPEVPAPAPAERPAGLANVPAKAPSKEQLKADATAAYKRAEDAGAVMTPESFATFKDTLQKAAQKRGLNATLHPDSSAAISEILKTDGPVTLERLETLRRIAKDAEGSVKPADRAMASKAVDLLDDYASTLSARDMVKGDPAAAAALKQARNFYSRASKAGELDELMRRAELSAPGFSGSGMENAIRTEFRSLAKNQRRMRLFTPEERAAIERVAKGGPVENALRFLGKASPTGIVSAGLGTGIGAALGGPAGAVAVPVVGFASRYAATRMTLKNAEAANELVRRGPPPKSTNVLRKRNALAETRTE